MLLFIIKLPKFNVSLRSKPQQQNFKKLSGIALFLRMPRKYNEMLTLQSKVYDKLNEYKRIRSYFKKRVRLNLVKLKNS